MIRARSYLEQHKFPKQLVRVDMVNSKGKGKLGNDLGLPLSQEQEKEQKYP